MVYSTVCRKRKFIFWASDEKNSDQFSNYLYKRCPPVFITELIFSVKILIKGQRRIFEMIMEKDEIRLISMDKFAQLEKTKDRSKKKLKSPIKKIKKKNLSLREVLRKN